jgi:hypothetical protein
MALIGILSLLTLAGVGLISLGWRIHLMTRDPEEYRRVRSLEREYKEARNAAIVMASRRLFKKPDVEQ